MVIVSECGRELLEPMAAGVGDARVELQEDAKA
jgi:hypothetical protein